MNRRTAFRHLAILSLATALSTGCNDGGGDDAGGVGNAVGTWEFLKVGGSTTWWAFSSDGSFVMYDDPALTERHLSGTFTQSGASVTGSFTNPGVGTGDIEGTISEDGTQFALTFIEHWHTPNKRVPLSGTRQ